MPGGNTHFNRSWSQQKDSNGDLIANWCSPGNDVWSASCTYCKKMVAINHSGLEHVLQHARGSKQQSNLAVRRSSNQLKFDVKASTAATNVLKCIGEDVICAELIWAIKVATKKMSYRSCDSINDTFNAIFSCSITESSHLAGQKCHIYLLMRWNHI